MGHAGELWDVIKALWEVDSADFSSLTGYRQPLFMSKMQTGFTFNIQH